MTEFWSWLAGGAGSILLALLAGAGGSALLELLWRPRRDRRRAASLIVAEVAMNTELLLLQAHARKLNPAGIPADLRLSTLAWGAAGELVSELPTPLVRKLVVLYNQFESLNGHVQAFGIALQERDGTTRGSVEREKAERMLAGIVDVFNTGIDSTIGRGQEVVPELADLALVKETEEQRKQVVDYSAIAAKAITERNVRISEFQRRFRSGQ